MPSGHNYMSSNLLCDSDKVCVSSKEVGALDGIASISPICNGGGLINFNLTSGVQTTQVDSVKAGTKSDTCATERGETSKCVKNGEYDTALVGRVGDNGDLDNPSMFNSSREVVKNGENHVCRRNEKPQVSTDDVCVKADLVEWVRPHEEV